jgi:EAL domain-containing protein (putative c-di-GMP-specific phosphodiesterase class I)/GGDEF domain-containing protein
MEFFKLSVPHDDQQSGKNCLLINRPSERPGQIGRLINADSLNIVSQPIVDLVTGSIFAHEALVRGPKDSLFRSQDDLLMLARSEDSLFELETACVVKSLKNWSQMGHGGQVLIYVSSSALASVFRGSTINAITSSIEHFGIAPKDVIFEITEHEHILGVPDFISVARNLNSAGLRIALDDFGDGRSSLRLWAELAPAMVKVDKYYTKDIASDTAKVKTIRAMIQMADNFDFALIAEGIETVQDLQVLRDMGIKLGQGDFLGMPQTKPVQKVDAKTQLFLAAKFSSFLPSQTPTPQKITLRESMIISAPSLTREVSNAEVIQIFVDNPNFHSLAVVEGAYPVAIISRAVLLSQGAKPYFLELFGKKSCMRHANLSPRTVELDQDVQDLIGILTSQDQRYQTEGFIYTKNGQYVGMGMGEHLANLVAESRLEAARHANPLTSLPGNIPISEHINRLLERKVSFIVAYADLANFKPFNDHYGFWRGDEVIKLVAATMLRHLDSALDFIGHVGGDDFLLVFQSEDWHARLSNCIAEFDLAAVKLYDETAILAGGIEAEDRDGRKRFFPLTTLYAGAVHVYEGSYNTASEVSSAAATARHNAKTGGMNIYIIEAPDRMAQ